MTEILTESFCERCGTRYTFESAAPRKSRVGRVRTVSKGLKNFVLSDETTLSEAMADARSDEERSATASQLDAFHRTFNFCLTCRQYTCGNCWNTAEGRCLTCMPIPGMEAAQDLRAVSPIAFVDGANGAHAHETPPEDVVSEAWPEEDVGVERLGRVMGAAAIASDADLDDAEAADSEIADAEAAAELEAAAEIEAMDDEAVAARVDGVAPGQSVEDAVAAYEAQLAAEEAERVAEEAERLAEAERVAEAEQAAEEERIAAAALAAAEAERAAEAQRVAEQERVAAAALAAAALAAATQEAERAAAEEADQLAAQAAAEEAERAAALALAAATEEADRAAAAEEAERAADAERRAAAALAAAALVAAHAEAERAAAQAAAEEAERVNAAERAAALAAAEEAARVAEAERQVAAQAEADRVAAEAEAERQVAAQAEADRVAAEAAAAAEAELAAAAAREDVVSQPTWLTVAPDEGNQPEWPAAPLWGAPAPDRNGATPTLAGRPLLPREDAAALWAASAREVLTGSARATQPEAAPTPTVQPCVSCGLSLSANARFCRRCGTRQG